jgi:membrane-associated phospholipid phosphatase
MVDPTPDYRNRFAYWVGRVFHPYLICIPTLAAVLSDLPFSQALGWVVLVVVVLVAPLIVIGALLQRQARFLHQRTTRTPIYLAFWGSLLVCLVLLIILQAPPKLSVCIVALALWLPVQLVINTYVTKVSTHAAVVAGCMTGLLLLGELNHVLLFIGALAAVVLTLWARVVTRHHTWQQVAMGTLTGALPVLIVFPLLLDTL